MNAIGRSLCKVTGTITGMTVVGTLWVHVAVTAASQAIMPSVIRLPIATTVIAKQQRQMLAQAPPPKEFELKDFAYWSTQCRSLSDEQLYQESLTACETAIPLATEKDPKVRQNKTLELWKVRSDDLFNLGRYPDALTSYDYVLTIQPAYSQGLTRRCDVLSRLGRYDAAIVACELALKVDGDWGKSNPANAWAIRANALQKVGTLEADVPRKVEKLEEAMVSYDQALVANPEDKEIAAERCTTVFGLKKAQDSALSTAQEAVQKVKPDSAEATLAQAQVEERKHAVSNTEAEGIKCTAAMEKPKDKPEKPDNTEPQKPSASLLFKQGLVFNSQGRTADAKQAFQDAAVAYEQELAVNPTNAQSWIYQGMALEQLHQDARALTAYEKALQLQPNSSFALVNQCGTLNRLKRFQEALSACENAFKGDKAWGERNPAYAWNQRSQALLGAKRYEDAAASADRAIALTPDDAEPYTYKAASLWYLKDYEEAEAAARKATALKADYPQAHAVLGKILATQKRYTAALSEYNQAIDTYQQGLSTGQLSRNPAFLTDVNTNKASALWRLGRPGEALPLARRIAVENPQSFEAQYNYGLIALDAKAYEQALSAFQTADGIHPQNIKVITGQGLVLEGLGKLREALIAFNSALSINPNFEPARTGHDETYQRLREQLKQQVLRELK